MRSVLMSAISRQAICMSVSTSGVIGRAPSRASRAISRRLLPRSALPSMAKIVANAASSRTGAAPRMRFDEMGLLSLAGKSCARAKALKGARPARRARSAICSGDSGTERMRRVLAFAGFGRSSGMMPQRVPSALPQLGRKAAETPPSQDRTLMPCTGKRSRCGKTKTMSAGNWLCLTSIVLATGFVRPDPESTAVSADNHNTLGPDDAKPIARSSSAGCGSSR